MNRVERLGSRLDNAYTEIEALKIQNAELLDALKYARYFASNSDKCKQSDLDEIDAVIAKVEGK